MDFQETGRTNQKRRTRKNLLDAASRLMKNGRIPSLEEVASDALVSRATAYRYFPSVQPLLLEASLDVVTPEAKKLFEKEASNDPVVRVERVDSALDEMMLANEMPLRMMLAHSLERGSDRNSDKELPARQNRRAPLIDAALEPAKSEFKPAALEMLKKTLSLIIGTEAMIVFKDVLQLNDEDARKVKRWAIRALVEAARKSN